MATKINTDRPMPAPEMFTGILGEISTAYLDGYQEADPAGIYASLLSLVGAAMGSSPFARMGGKQPLIFHTMLVGRSSVGRKGTATNDGAMPIFEAAMPSFAEDCVSAGMPSSGKQIVQKVAEMAVISDHMFDIDEIDPMFQEDAAKFPVLRIMPGFSGAIIEEEWVKALKRARMDDQFDPNCRMMWQGSKLSCLHPKGQIQLKDPRVSLITHITPKELVTTLSDAAVAGGSANRFLYFYVERTNRVRKPKPLSEERVRSLGAKLAERILWGQKQTEIKMTAEADRYWEKELADQLDEVATEDTMMEEFAGRAAPYCVRIAALLALMDRRNTITVPDLKSAAAVIEYGFASIKHIMAGTHIEVASIKTGEKIKTFGNPDEAKPAVVDKVRRGLRMAGERGAGKTELIKEFGVTNTTAADRENALGKLLKDGEVEYEQKTKPGSFKPTDWFTLIETEEYDAPVRYTEEPKKAAEPRKVAPKVKTPTTNGQAVSVSLKPAQKAIPVVQPKPKASALDILGDL